MLWEIGKIVMYVVGGGLLIVFTILDFKWKKDIKKAEKDNTVN